MDDLRDKSRHVADAGHQAGYHIPSKRATVESTRLPDDWTYSVCFHDTPDEEGDTRNRHNHSFDCEQMTTVDTTQYAAHNNGLPAGTHILWMGNHMAGRDMSQKRKKHMKSFVVVPEDSGR